MDQCGFAVLVAFAAGVHCRVDHYDFTIFILGCAFDSALSYLGYHRSAETLWSFVSTFPC